MPQIPSRIASKYTKLFVDTETLVRIVNHKGTMQPDIKAMREVIAAKLADKEFMQALVKDYMRYGEVKF